jgi:SAM-dependent methyltransferase
MSEPRDQRSFWTDDVGHIWVAQRAAMDAILAPVLAGALTRAGLRAGEDVLDIGCGAGTSTLTAAQSVGDQGHVTGFDISVTLLNAARARAEGHANIIFVEADAETHPFPPLSADVIISRFGVMFFQDNVTAFRNMAAALRPQGRISFAAWGAIEENPFFTLPARTARELFGPTPRSDPDAPGPFALRDPRYVEQILQAAGLDARVEVATENLYWHDGAEALAVTLCEIGPAQSALNHHGVDAAGRAALVDALVADLKPYCTDAGITIPAQINYATARKAT